MEQTLKKQTRLIIGTLVIALLAVAAVVGYRPISQRLLEMANKPGIEQTAEGIIRAIHDNDYQRFLSFYAKPEQATTTEQDFSKISSSVKQVAPTLEKGKTYAIRFEMTSGATATAYIMMMDDNFVLQFPLQKQNGRWYISPRKEG